MGASCVFAEGASTFAHVEVREAAPPAQVPLATTSIPDPLERAPILYFDLGRNWKL